MDDDTRPRWITVCDDRPQCENCDRPATVLAGQLGPRWIMVCDDHFGSLDEWWEGSDPSAPRVPSYQLVRIY